MGGTVRAAGALALLIALGGCASMNSVHWVFPGPGKSRVTSTDAFQRHLIMTQDSAGQIRACSEASPDAMAVFSAALTGRGVLGPSERQLEAAAAMGQTAATIERTQTINMLREWMYRTCELWLSGALTTEEFLTRSARDHRSMITILSVEQLTGVIKPPATIVSGPGVSAARAQSEQLVELIGAYRKERETAEAAESVAAAEFVTANIEHDDGEGTKKRICEFANAPANGIEAHTKCKTAEQRAASTKTTADAARGREKSLLDQLTTLSAGLAAAVNPGPHNVGGVNGGVSRIGQQELQILAATVERIALTSGVDEALMFCVTYLRDGSDQDTRATCNDVVADAATADRLLLDPDNDALRAILENPAAQRAGIRLGDAFVSFRNDLLARINATPARLQEHVRQFETRAGLTNGSLSAACSAQAECRRRVMGSIELQAAFNADPPASQQRLREALVVFDN